jgi:glycosyltransferase involved in cell wall biosynthesis
MEELRPSFRFLLSGGGISKQALARVYRDATECELRSLIPEIRLVAGSGIPKLSRDSVAVTSLVYNGAPYVDDFVRHYTRLGVSHIFLIDNGSTDETLDIARKYGNVTVYQSLLPFKSHKNQMRRFLLSKIVKTGWRLLVDIDELFDYPGSAVLTLADLTRYLDRHGFNAVVAQMLDMFSDQYYNVGGIRKRTGFRECTVSNKKIQEYYGGIRKLVFGADCFLSKHPLFRYEHDLVLLSPHMVAGAKLADFSCVLFHYKFLSDFRERVDEAVKKGNYYKDSVEYKLYASVLSKGDLSLNIPGSRKLEAVDELVTQGFLVVSPNYKKYIREKSARESS